MVKTGDGGREGGQEERELSNVGATAPRRHASATATENLHCWRGRDTEIGMSSLTVPGETGGVEDIRSDREWGISRGVDVGTA